MMPVKKSESVLAHDYFAVSYKNDGQVAHYLVRVFRLLKAAQCGQETLVPSLPSGGKPDISIYPVDKYLWHSLFLQLHRILRPTASYFPPAVFRDFLHIGGGQVLKPVAVFSGLSLKGVPDCQDTIDADIFSLSAVDYRLPCAFSSLVVRNNKNYIIPSPEVENAHKEHKGYSGRFAQCDVFSNKPNTVCPNSDNEGNHNLYKVISFPYMECNIGQF